MPQTALTNLGINYDWNAAEDGWKAGMDNNLVLLDWTGQPYISVDPKSVSAEPGSPADGAVYIIGASPTGTNWGTRAENDIAIFNTTTDTNDGWTFTTPREGWEVWDRVNDTVLFFDGVSSDWIQRGKPGFGFKVLNDTLGDYTIEWTEDANSLLVTSVLFDYANDSIFIPSNATEPFAIGTRLQFVNDSTTATDDLTFADDAAVTWRSQTALPEVTLNPGGLVGIIKTGTNEWAILDLDATGVHNTDVEDFTGTVNIDIRWAIDGRVVTLEAEDFTGTNSGGSTLVTQTALPSLLRPVADVSATAIVENNGTQQLGKMVVGSDGIITWTRIPEGAFSGGGDRGAEGSTVTYNRSI